MILGNDITKWESLMQAYQLLGFCPQVDPLWDNLSGRDHLFFYGRIKGVREAELGATVDQMLSRLGLQPTDAAKAAGKYSGGMKRKLSVGIALIGHSPVLFLDEPSAAVDAGAKRHLWKVIKNRGPDQTVILTTHSMEEAEALCNRLAIQVRGQLRCLGSSMHLKSRYSSGYRLELILEHSGEQTSGGHDGSLPIRTTSGSSGMDRVNSFTQKPSEQVAAFVQDKVSPQAKLLEHVANRCIFQLPSHSETGAVPLSHVFGVLEGHKEAMGIESYSVNQPSLEQVFLRFAREQTDSAVTE